MLFAQIAACLVVAVGLICFGGNTDKTPLRYVIAHIALTLGGLLILFLSGLSVFVGVN